MSDIVLEMSNISKSFGGIQALSGINFQLKFGEIHALLGENGAGKSTLIKVLGGIHKPDTGEIYINGEAINIEGVQDAQNAGIGIIHQEIVMVPELTVAENIFLGREPLSKNGLIDHDYMNSQATNMVKQLGLNIDVETKVRNLTIAQQQLVEITKAVSFDIKILVMDEPTSSLTGSDVELLFNTMRKLQSNGISIIYISHRFEELFAMTDRITVIRDGNYVDTLITENTDTQELVRMMVGRDIDNLYTRTEGNITEEEVLTVKNLSSKNYFENISFNVRAGEIVGFSGLVGSGRSELMMAIFGALPKDGGEIYVDGKKAFISNTREAIKYGMAMVPEDRKDQGLFLENTVGFNLTLANLPNLMRNKLFISEDEKEKSIDYFSKALRIKSASPDVEVSTLSGGNQQKVVIAKWLSTKPKILILDEPTRGVDVGAKSEIYTIIDDLSKEGIGIIVISSDLPEILNMADRTYVMKDGKIAGEVNKENMTQEIIMNYATGGETI